MNKMSKDEATEKLKELVARCKECKFATCENCEINWNEVQAIETILDLYQKEKAKVEEYRIGWCNTGEKLEQEKEKNKELEDVLKLMSIALTPFETPTNGVIWTSSEVRNTFFETIKKIDSERLKELLEEE